MCLSQEISSDRIDDVACIGSFTGSFLLKFIKSEEVGPIHELKI